MKTYYCVTTEFYDNGQISAAITNEVQADVKPENTSTVESAKDIYRDWFESEKEAKAFIEEAKEA